MSLQRAFASGAVAAGLALVVSFWVPPFAGHVKPNTSGQMLAAEMTALEVEAEPVGVDD
jgi:hypothetical protein